MPIATTPKRILVTGATGMIGQAVARKLARDHPDWTVFGAARFSDSKLRQRLEQEGVRCVTLDLADPALPGLPDDIDTLFHFAVAWPAGTNDAVAMEVNGRAVGRLLTQLKQLRQFIIGSTVAVYTGGGQRHELTENSPTIPGGIYGTSKLIGDELAGHIARTRQMPGAILRFWFPYTDDLNAKQDYYQDLLAKMRRGETFTLPRDGGGCQQPVFIDDIVETVLKSLEFANTQPFVLNVAGPHRLALREVVETMGEVFDLKPTIELSADGKSNLLSGSYDLSKLQQTCGMGRIQFRQGLLRLKAAMSQDRDAGG